MVRRCALCETRARGDGTCKNGSCSDFRPHLRGHHWASKRITNTVRKSFGPTSAVLGAFVVGGFALSRLHRHDIRTAIASGMYLKHFVSDAAKRIELLAVSYLCYWRWSTASVLRSITQPLARMEEFLLADSDRRADMLLHAFNEMSKEMGPRHVVGSREACRVDLLFRSESKGVLGGSKGCFGYHPYSNPASRRTGAQEFHILLPDMRSGNLRRASEDLARMWYSGASGAPSKPTYRAAQKVLMRIKLWSHADYGRIRWSTLC